jgi:hypothetical protein
MQSYNKKGLITGSIAETTPIPKQLLSMTLHLGYLTVTKGHQLTGLTPVARTE